MKFFIISFLSVLCLIGCRNSIHSEPQKAEIEEPSVYAAIEEYISENKTDDYDLVLFEMFPFQSNEEIFFQLTVNYISPSYLKDKIYVLCDKIKDKSTLIITADNSRFFTSNRKVIFNDGKNKSNVKTSKYIFDYYFNRVIDTTNIIIDTTNVEAL